MQNALAKAKMQENMIACLAQSAFLQAFYKLHVVPANLS